MIGTRYFLLYSKGVGVVLYRYVSTRVHEGFPDEYVPPRRQALVWLRPKVRNQG